MNRILTNGRNEVIVDSDGRWIAEIHGRTKFERVGRARLMMNAQDLLDALRELADRVEQIELADGSTPCTMRARSAINAAIVGT